MILEGDVIVMISGDCWVAIGQNWPFWLVSVVLVMAAIIDGVRLKVPNWLTYSLVISGWAYSLLAGGWQGLLSSLLGTAVGLGLLLPAYAIGGMGAGDVKLLAGVGAWVYSTHTFYAFCISAIVGGFLAVAMVIRRGAVRKHAAQLQAILLEIMTVRDPNQLAAIAADRKGSMLLRNPNHDRNAYLLRMGGGADLIAHLWRREAA
jgi:prepilin peptidase CpaA